jgi:hypothetical protein
MFCPKQLNIISNAVKRKVKITDFLVAAPAIIMRIISFSLLLYGFTICLYSSAFAQDNRWVFIDVDVNGSRFYLDKNSRTTIGDRVRVWDRSVYSDGSYRINLSEWQCSQKRFFFVDVSIYSETGSFIRKDKGTGWINVVPDAISESMYEAVCSNSSEKKNKTISSSKKIAEIIVEKANIRTEPNTDSRVIRQAKTGERFVLAEEESSNGWYQIILSQTNELAWIHGSNIKLVDAVNKSNVKNPKMRRQIKRQKSN